MAMKTPKREFEDLVVGDVSIVDEAANEREFLTLKNKGEPQMPQTANAPAAKTTVQVNSNAVQADLLTEIQELSAKVEKGVSAKDKTDAMDPAAVLAALGEIKTLVAKARDQMAQADSKPAEPAPKPADAAAAQDAVLGATLEAIAKARVFTPKRQEALKAAISTLKGLLEELENMPDGGSKNIPTEAAKPPTLPGDHVPGGTGLQEITKALKELTDVTKDLKGRMETVEKARLAPTGGPPTDTDTKVEKNQGNKLWGNVLKLK